jgi:hypothetical protein
MLDLKPAGHLGKQTLCYFLCGILDDFGVIWAVNSQSKLWRTHVPRANRDHPSDRGSSKGKQGTGTRFAELGTGCEIVNRSGSSPLHGFLVENARRPECGREAAVQTGSLKQTDFGVLHVDGTRG